MPKNGFLQKCKKILSLAEDFNLFWERSRKIEIFRSVVKRVGNLQKFAIFDSLSKYIIGLLREKKNFFSKKKFFFDFLGDFGSFPVMVGSFPVFFGWFWGVFGRVWVMFGWCWGHFWWFLTIFYWFFENLFLVIFDTFETTGKRIFTKVLKNLELST